VISNTWNAARPSRPVAWTVAPAIPRASYAGFPPLWLVTLWAARATPTLRSISWTVAAWAVLSSYWPTDVSVDPRILAVANAVPQTVALILAIAALRGHAIIAAERAEPPRLEPQAATG
jgi:hypothetical protein